MNKAWERNGFSLIEVVPAVFLLSAISMISLKFLLIDIRLQEQIRWKQFIMQSHRRVFRTGVTSINGIALCLFDQDTGWEVLYFPDGSWIPQKMEGDNWVIWRTRILNDYANDFIGSEYSMPGTSEWVWWDSLSTMEIKNDRS